MWRLLLGVARRRLMDLAIPCEIHWLLRVLLRLLLVWLRLIIYLIPIGLLTMLRDLRLKTWLLRHIEVICLGLDLAVLRWPWSRHAGSALCSLTGVYGMPGSARVVTRQPR